jgi:hypothetical protein
MDEEKLLAETKNAQESAQKRYLGGLVYTCRQCKVTFIGPSAVSDWSAHTWTHYFEDGSFAND